MLLIFFTYGIIWNFNLNVEKNIELGQYYCKNILNFRDIFFIWINFCLSRHIHKFCDEKKIYGWCPNFEKSWWNVDRLSKFFEILQYFANSWGIWTGNLKNCKKIKIVTQKQNAWCIKFKLFCFARRFSRKNFFLMMKMNCFNLFFFRLFLWRWQLFLLFSIYFFVLNLEHPFVF